MKALSLTLIFLMFLQRSKQYQYRRNFGLNFRHKFTESHVKVYSTPELQDKVKIFNTLTRRKEKFIPLNYPEVKFYRFRSIMYYCYDAV